MKDRLFSTAGRFFAGLALVLMVWAVIGSRVDDPAPINVPMSTTPGQPVTGQFRAPNSTTYCVSVDLRRGLPFDELQQILEKPPPLAWSVTSRGRSVGRPYHGVYWGNTVGYEVGQFTATAGQWYHVQARFRTPVPLFHSLNPHLSVIITPVKTEMTGFRSAFLFTAALLVAVLAVCLSRPVRHVSASRYSCRTR